jgi:hypothetical protein
MRKQAAKLSAHVEALLDILLDTYSKWTLLEPILKERSAIAFWGGGARARSLEAVRRSLAHVCVLNIAHLAFEADKRAPSIQKVVGDLTNRHVLHTLRGDFVRFWAGTKSEPQYLELKLDAEARFDRSLSDARHLWSELEDSKELRALKTLRDKSFAHVELMFRNGAYRRFDGTALGVRWRDIGLILDQMAPVVLALNSVCRNAGFDMTDATQRMRDNARLFWAPRAVA